MVIGEDGLRKAKDVGPTVEGELHCFFRGRGNARDKLDESREEIDDGQDVLEYDAGDADMNMVDTDALALMSPRERGVAAVVEGKAGVDQLAKVAVAEGGKDINMHSVRAVYTEPNVALLDEGDERWRFGVVLHEVGVVDERTAEFFWDVDPDRRLFGINSDGEALAESQFDGAGGNGGSAACPERGREVVLSLRVHDLLASDALGVRGGDKRIGIVLFHT